MDIEKIKIKTKKLIANMDFWLLTLLIIDLLVSVLLLVLAKDNSIIINIACGFLSSGIVSLVIELMHLTDNIKKDKTEKQKFYSNLKYYIADFLFHFDIYINESHSNTIDLLNNAINVCELKYKDFENLGDIKQAKMMSDIKFICQPCTSYQLINPYTNDVILERYEINSKLNSKDILRLIDNKLKLIDQCTLAKVALLEFKYLLGYFVALIENDPNLAFFNNLSYQSDGEKYRISILHNKGIKSGDLKYLEYIAELKFPHLSKTKS